MIKSKNINKLILAACLLLAACSPKEYFDNQQMIKTIDAMPFSKRSMKMELDSMGNTVDTLFIAKLKYDEKGMQRYNERTFFFKNEQTTTVIQYYKDDEDLFYRETESGDDDFLRYETKSIIDGEIEGAIQIAQDGEEVDTTIITYEYQYHLNGKRKNLIVKTKSQKVGELYLTLTYNLNERPSFETMIMEGDTLSFQTWEYENDLLSQMIICSYSEGSLEAKTVYTYGKEERLMEDIMFGLEDGDLVKTVETKYEYDEADDLIGEQELNLATGKVKVYKYFNETL